MGHKDYLWSMYDLDYMDISETDIWSHIPMTFLLGGTFWVSG